MSTSVNIVWLRRDLRLSDNHALSLAQAESEPFIPVFIFDKHILNKLEDEDDARVTFIFRQVEKLKDQLQTKGCDLLTYYNYPLEAWKAVLARFTVKKVFVNTDYEPYAKERDQQVATFLSQQQATLISVKDQVIFHEREITTNDGGIYKVYGHYKKKWLNQLSSHQLPHYGTLSSEKLLPVEDPTPLPSLSAMGFRPNQLAFPPKELNEDNLRHYHELRNYPYQNATSHLGIHLRFGTISIRQLVKQAQRLNQVYLLQLIWREFFMNILNHFPYVTERSFKSKFDHLPWRNNEQEFERWCQGSTGVPLVDAGMRQLNQTGFMHNRVRMVCASFLTRNLLIDWRWGEAYFARKLLDYELANNNGGWQWAAGTGVDAQPYFRVFNPLSQANTWDQEMHYIRQWVPEWNTEAYPQQPMVDLKQSRERALAVYRKVAKADN